MVRQAVFVLLGLAQASALDGQIPLARLTPQARIAVQLAPGAAASDAAAWLRDAKAGTIVRVAAKDNAISAPVSVNKPCASLVSAFKTLWVPSCSDRIVARIDEADLKITAKAGIEIADADGQIAAAVGSIWVITDRKGILARIDPDTNEPVAEIHLHGGAAAVLSHADALWVTSGRGRTLTRINPHNNEIIETIDVGPEPARLTAADDAVWTLNRGDGSVTRVDTKSNKVVTTISIGKEVATGEIAAGDGSVWISAPGLPLMRIDARTNKVAQRFSGAGGGAILFAHGSLWLNVGAETWRLDPKLAAAMRY